MRHGVKLTSFSQGKMVWDARNQIASRRNMCFCYICCACEYMCVVWGWRGPSEFLVTPMGPNPVKRVGVTLDRTL